MVLARAARKLDVRGTNQQMVIRRRRQNAAADDPIAVVRILRRERSDPCENVGKSAVELGCHVQYHEHGGSQIGGQKLAQTPERLDAAGRCAGHHDAGCACFAFVGLVHRGPRAFGVPPGAASLRLPLRGAKLTTGYIASHEHG